MGWQVPNSQSKRSLLYGNGQLNRNSQLCCLISPGGRQPLVVDMPHFFALDIVSSSRIWLDAIYTKIRIEGKVNSAAGLIAIGLREDGHSDVLGLHLGNRESYYNNN